MTCQASGVSKQAGDCRSCSACLLDYMLYSGHTIGKKRQDNLLEALYKKKDQYIFKITIIYIGRCSGLTASALDFRSSDLGSSLGWGTALCSWPRHFTFIVPLFTQVYKWVLVNLLLRVTLRQTSIPSTGEQKYFQSLHAKEIGIRSASYGPLGSYKDCSFYLYTHKKRLVHI